MAAITFEKAMEKIEGIVEQLEKGDVSLEKSITLYDEGLKLCTSCQKQLAQAALKIEEFSAEVQDGE